MKIIRFWLVKTERLFENVDKNRPSLHCLAFAGTYHFDDEALVTEAAPTGAATATSTTELPTKIGKGVSDSLAIESQGS